MPEGPQCQQAHQLYILMQTFANIAEWCFVIIFILNKQANEGIHKKPFIWPKSRSELNAFAIKADLI